MSETVCIYAIRKQKILVDLTGDTPGIPRLSTAGNLGLQRQDGYHIGKKGDCECLAFPVPDDAVAPHGMEFIGVRKAFAVLVKSDYALAVRALGIINWDRTCRYCSVCGGKLVRHETVLGKNCTSCGFTMFPKISPAVIVLVEKDNQVLLARASRVAEHLCSVL
ncbi:MAG: NUDIX-like domain-containing protein, partial [Syntrophorhabdus sp.]